MKRKNSRYVIAALALLMLAAAILTIVASLNQAARSIDKVKVQNKSSILNLTSPSVMPSPTSTMPKIKTKLPSVMEIRRELEELSHDQLAALKETAEETKNAENYLRLAVAYELADMNREAIDSLHKAISIVPDARELYEEMGKLTQAENRGIIAVYVNGEKVSFKDGNDEVTPIIIRSYTLVPIRKIAEKLGARVNWDERTRTATIRSLDTILQLTQDSTLASVNGHPANPALIVPARNLNGHIVVPLRFVGEQFNKLIDFIPGDYDTAIITILDKS